MDERLIAFTAVAAVLTVTPGADTMLVLRSALRGGTRDGVLTTAGICSGGFLHATLSAAGLSAILVHSATAFHSVKLAGAAYLAYLGWKALRSALFGSGEAAESALDATPPPARRLPFAEGFLTNLLNPKVAVFYLAFLPQFLAPGDPVLATSLLMAAIHGALGLVWLGSLSTVVGRSRRGLTRPTVRRWLEAACGTALLALGVRLAFAER